MSLFKYLPQFIKEVMRYYSPVPVIARQSSEEVIIDGKTVPPNLRLDINIWAILHNPDVWKCPEVTFLQLIVSSCMNGVACNQYWVNGYLV